LGLLGLAFEIYEEMKRPVLKSDHKSRGLAWAGIIAGATILGAATWFFWPLKSFPPIDQMAICLKDTAAPTTLKRHEDQITFEVKKESVASKLGAPTDCLRLMPLASEGLYEHARILWIVSPQKRFVISRTADSWKEQADETCRDNWCADADEWMRKFRKRPPNGLFPPFGGTAKFLEQNPSAWSDFGWLVWHCEMQTDTSLFWEFENGYVFGVYPTDTKNQGGQVFILYKRDHTFEIRNTGSRGTACDYRRG
jgi:hypothetical protein